MKKIAFIVGTRPQLLKAEYLAPVINRDAGLDVVAYDTGQHFSKCMTPKSKLQRLPKKVSADLIVSIGDTDSSVTAALIAKKHSIPIAHIEAGLRCNDLSLKEEQNRVLVDHLSDLLLCSTTSGVDNAIKEKLIGTVKFTGDVMLDMIKKDYYHWWELTARGTILTLHRQATVDDKDILSNTIKRAKKMAVGDITFVLHPRTFARLGDFGMIDELIGMTILPPLPRPEFLSKMCNAEQLLTDSGGAAREAFFIGTPFEVLRGSHEFEDDFKCIDNFGDGTAGTNIAFAIKDWLE